MIRQVEKVFTITQMVLPILVNGKMINNRVKVEKLGLMVPNMMVTSNREKSMEMELCNLLMAHGTKGLLITMIFKEMVFMCGQTEKDMKVNGYKIRCLVLEKLFNQTAEFMKVSIIKRKNMVTADLLGQIKNFMKDIGKMENSMEKDYM